MMEPLLRMMSIRKRFPGVQALDDAGLEVLPGEIHALLGENGAGKSTLIKILAGAQQPDSGTIEFAGQNVVMLSPHDAQRRGIATIYQEFTLAPNMTIAENVFIGREPGTGFFVDWGKMAAETKAITQRLGLQMQPMAAVRNLSVAEQQMVEIARALSMKSRLIVMDEPTSALSLSEVDKLFRIARELKAQGLSIIFVTHRLEEVMEICDRYTVLRDGRLMGSGSISEITIDGIIRLMVGRQVKALFAHRDREIAGDVVLKVEGLNRRGNTQDQNATVLADVGFEVRAGEILGVAGLVGAGRTEMARALFGADAFDSGRIIIDGQEVHIRSPKDAIGHGIGLVPEDRKQQALFLALAVRVNLSMASHKRILRWGVFIDETAERTMVEEYRKKLNIRMASQDQLIANLSGGNQQKVTLARWLALRPKVLIVDEPTRGIDIVAKVEVHNLLFEMAQSGIAVVAISSELPEVLAISDRIITMREGRVTGQIKREDATEEILMSMMTLSVKPT
ncbi:MAG: sugar ABC transporter ATP-binding protein [Verrucomicrobia bacterium]|nr:sugar ABC transporter ATP-binding protein [Verrucomicrobiota bacterium]